MREKKNNKKNKKSNVLFIIIFILGLLIAAYPVFSRYYYKIDSNFSAEEYEKERKKLEKKEIEKRMSLAKAYNAAMAGKLTYKDPYVSNIKQGIDNYAHMLELKEKIGVVIIPKLKIKEPIYAGTSEEVLQRGIGHIEGTSLPIGGANTHCVIAGHRGLPQKELFAHLDKLQKGDVFYIENLQKTMKYKVVENYIIEPSQVQYLKITPGKDMCTLLTCHPYMINSHRMLVTGVRVPYNPAVDKTDVSLIDWKVIGIIAALVLLILILIIKRVRRRSKMKEKPVKEKNIIEKSDENSAIPDAKSHVYEAVKSDENTEK